jgi:hypothetical protein
MNIEEIKDSLQRNNFTGLRARLDSAIEFIDEQQAEIEALKQQLVTTSSEAKLNYSKGHEDGRQLGMKQERALWELAASTQEIMDTHPVKEHFEDEPQAEELHEILQSNNHPAELTDEEIIKVNEDIGTCWDVPHRFAIQIARAILRKAQEK